MPTPRLSPAAVPSPPHTLRVAGTTFLRHRSSDSPAGRERAPRQCPAQISGGQVPLDPPQRVPLTRPRLRAQTSGFAGPGPGAAVGGADTVSLGFVPAVSSPGHRPCHRFRLRLRLKRKRNDEARRGPHAVQGHSPEGRRSQSAEPVPRDGRPGRPEGDRNGRTNARLMLELAGRRGLDTLRSGELPGDTPTERHPPGGTKPATENGQSQHQKRGSVRPATSPRSDRPSLGLCPSKLRSQADMRRAKP